MLFIFILCIPVAILILSFAFYVEKKEDERQCLNGTIDYNAYNSLIASHVCGLPLGENSQCKLYLTQNQIIVESTSNIFKLDKEKILDTSLKTSTEIQNSISGAVGGSILLGPVGAFIGGSDVKSQMFLIFVYENETENKCMTFMVKDTAGRYDKAREFVKDFKRNVRNKKEIKL